MERIDRTSEVSARVQALARAQGLVQTRSQRRLALGDTSSLTSTPADQSKVAQEMARMQDKSTDIRAARRAAESVEMLRERIVQLEKQLEDEVGVRKDAQLRASFGTKQLAAERTSCGEVISSASQQVRGLNQKPLELMRKIQDAIKAKEASTQRQPALVEVAPELSELRQQLAAEREQRRRDQAAYARDLAKLQDKLRVEQALRADAETQAAALEQQVVETVRAAKDVRLQPGIAASEITHHIKVQKAALHDFCGTLGEAITDSKPERSDHMLAEVGCEAAVEPNPQSPQVVADDDGLLLSRNGQEGPSSTVSEAGSEENSRLASVARQGALVDRFKNRSPRRGFGERLAANRLGRQEQQTATISSGAAAARQRSPIHARAKPAIIRTVPSTSRLPTAPVRAS